MEVRDFALAIVSTPGLDTKLAPAPAGLTDRDPRPGDLPLAPARPDELRIVPGRSVKRLPSLAGMRDPRQRARILHALANHELQAVELFGWALLAFPDAPPAFRRGLLRILGDEQRHTRMYASRLASLGFRFGDFPVTGYFWNKIERYSSPARFVCAMSLTFENANLDHSLDYAAAARAAGDEATAAACEEIHRDEIRHVRFGWIWLARFKAPEQTMWEAWRANLAWPMRPALARGRTFHPESRARAGMDAEFIHRLGSAAEAEPPPGRNRRMPGGDAATTRR